jgi:predicted ATPase/class 3 adenylate cyclase/Tfp pilus assembly protein PilF
MSNQVPTGTVTIVFTDIAGHTKMWEQVGDEFMPILEVHNSILRKTIAKYNGYEVKTEGDAFMLAFARASDAVLCAVEAQVALANHPWPEERNILVRMGMHTGEPQVSGNDYFGPHVIRANRVSDAGHGGQILISAATRELVMEELPEEVDFVDLGIHRLKDLGRPERIFQVNHPDLPKKDFPPLRTLDIIPNNLPVQLTSFVGREDEIRNIATLLGKEQVRLVTLTGTGGIGKTRLSVQVAADQLELFPDGVWFINIAPLTNIEQVITEIASTLSIHLQPRIDPKEQVIDYLSQRHLLLVLDNFEHLPEAPSFVNDLLRGAPFLRCLVTSREVLQIPGEQVFAVPPLSMPPKDADIETLSQYESVRLFIERVQAVKPNFELTPQNAAAIAAICHRLDGISLAIELAAARARGITVQQILERLSRQFEFLGTRSQTVPERHRTLRGAIDWSYDLLNPDEQKLFAQLSVFSGGFFLEAAEEICDVPDVFELLFNLQDKSLLVVKEVMEQTRYGMLGPLQAYAREKLGEDVELKKAYTKYYLKVAQNCNQQLYGAEESSALSQMTLELDNFRAAMDFAQEQEEGELLGELAIALYCFLYIRGFWSEGISRLRQAEKALRNLRNDKLLARAMTRLGWFYDSQGDYETARNIHTESLQIRRELGDKLGIAESLQALGIISIIQGAYDYAEQLFTESLEINRELGNEFHIAGALLTLGAIADQQGAYNEARELYTESLNIQRELGDKFGIAGTLNNLGEIALSQGAYDEAKRLFAESLKIKKELGSKSSIAESLYQFGKLAKSEANVEQGALFLLVAARLYEEMKSASSKGAMDVHESLAGIQKEMNLEQFEKLQGQAKAMSLERVIELAIS